MATALIKWSETEYEKVAYEIARANPEWNLLQAQSLADLQPVLKLHVNAAMDQVLPKERRRNIWSAFDVKEFLLKAYIRMRERGPVAPVADPVQGSIPDVALESAPVVERRRGLPPTKGVTPLHFDAKRLVAIPKVFWSHEEYDVLIGYIHRHYPSLTRDIIAAKKIMPRHLVEAQSKVLPEDRQRRNIVNISAGAREEILGAVTRLNLALAEKARLKAIAKEQAQAAALEAEREREATIQEIETRLSSEMGPTIDLAPTSVPEPVAPDQEAAAPVEPVPDVAPPQEPPALPSLDELTSEFAAHLADRFALAFVDALIPRMKTAFSAHLAGALADIVTKPNLPTVTPPSVAPTVIPKHNPAPPPSTTERKPKVVIVGPQPQQARELEMSYPHLNLTIVSGMTPNLKEQAKHADRVILMTKFMSHSTESSIRSVSGNRFHRVDGGVSSIKTLIDNLCNSGALLVPREA